MREKFGCLHEIYGHSLTRFWHKNGTVLPVTWKIDRAMILSSQSGYNGYGTEITRFLKRTDLQQRYCLIAVPLFLWEGRAHHLSLKRKRKPDQVRQRKECIRDRGTVPIILKQKNLRTELRCGGFQKINNTERQILTIAQKKKPQEIELPNDLLASGTAKRWFRLLSKSVLGWWGRGWRLLAKIQPKYIRKKSKSFEPT